MAVGSKNILILRARAHARASVLLALTLTLALGTGPFLNFWRQWGQSQRGQFQGGAVPKGGPAPVGTSPSRDTDPVGTSPSRDQPHGTSSSRDQPQSGPAQVGTSPSRKEHSCYDFLNDGLILTNLILFESSWSPRSDSGMQSHVVPTMGSDSGPDPCKAGPGAGPGSSPRSGQFQPRAGPVRNRPRVRARVRPSVRATFVEFTRLIFLHRTVECFTR